MLRSTLFATRLRISALALAALAMSGSPALAQKVAAALSGPSVIKVDEAATVSGTGLPANAAVTVMVVAPGGAKASFSAVTDAKGRVEHRVVASTSGRWQVMLLDSRGRELAQAKIDFLP